MDLKNCTVLVTSTSFGKDDPSLKTELEAAVGKVIYNPTGKPLSSQDLSRMLPGVDGFIAGLDTIDAAALQAADRLKVIARYGVGLDNVDLSAARERNIIVTNTPGANSASVAELAVGFMLCLARQIPAAVQAARGGNWPRLPGLSLKGKTVGLVGLGAIGKAVALRLKGFECRLLAFDPFPNREFATANGVELVDLSTLCANSDFISLHLPLTDETRNMVNAEFLAGTKKGAFLINTARGELIDEAALEVALRSGHLRGAALDVFIQEPPAPNHPLLAMPQVLVTPHFAAHADDATNAMGRMSMADCLAVLRGEDPLHRVI